MSLALAYINCRRCYELGQTTAPSTGSPEDKLYQLRVKEMQHQAQVEAMTNLEQTLGDESYIHVIDDRHYNPKKEKWFNPQLQIIGDGLTACLNCDGTSSSLAQHLKKSTSTIKTLTESEVKEVAHNYRTNAKPK